MSKKETMKFTNIIYWVSTAIVALMMIFSAYSYLTNPAMTQAFHHLGFPDYFRLELALAKLIGVILLLVPFTGRLKEWVYAGFTFTFVSASVAHLSSGDPTSAGITPLVVLAVLFTSYLTYHQRQKQSAPLVASASI